MAISTDYPRPIIVNGYSCRNCDDVASAKKNIDPSAPKPGSAEAWARAAVSFGGSLKSLNDKAYDDARPGACAAQQAGSQVNICC